MSFLGETAQTVLALFHGEDIRMAFALVEKAITSALKTYCSVAIKDHAGFQPWASIANTKRIYCF